MNIENILKQNWNRITKERIDMFEFLKTKHIFTYFDIQKKFSELWRASIFRNLKLFLEIWVIKKVNLWEKIETYEINEHEDYHEHMKCEKCKSIINFDCQEIYKLIIKEAERKWFKLKSHSILINWICKNCL